MKKKIAITVAAVGVAAVVAAVSAVQYRKSYTPVFAKGYTLTAHTGCEGTEDNSLEAIDAGIQAGADIVEFDLSFSTEGVAVLSHDAPKGRCVTLDEAFAKIAGYDGVRVNVDIKTYEDLSQVVTLAEKHGVSDRIFYTGVQDEDFINAIKADSPSVAYYLNLSVESSKAKDREYLLSLVDEVKNCGAIGINMNYKGCTKELAEVFHENGLLVSIWTVNSESAMKKVLSYGADNITTRYPSTLREIIENVRK